ncbi:hypothetical protein [Xanthovirga aplysinae]|uniref:hypothetical protein n=1 Tax=Xanthovirga aplysinae TaxID=2529853 RepID=UPI0012BC40A9|nr:hypothetical protein [Xanthovirga aplysinae]MTI32717.1 hypothetical protein [Xanthovirga aplysinae]
MNLTKVLTVVFSLIAVGLLWFLYSSVKHDIDEKARIERSEKAVIEKLKIIRTAEITYRSVNGQYTDSWDTLKAFITGGIIYNIQKKEEIITLDYGADSVITHVDTLGVVNVMDSVFKPSEYPRFNVATLDRIPQSDKKFSISAGTIQKSGRDVAVVEVVDTDPADPARKESNDIRNRKPLRFGSMTEVTTTGNWE